MFSSLILLCSSPILKIPTKNSPFFVICWCDEVLLDLIRGFRVLQVDLAFHPLFLNFHPQIFPNCPDLTSPRDDLRIHPRIQSADIRPDKPEHPAPRTSGHQARTSGPWQHHFLSTGHFPPIVRQILFWCPHILPHTSTTSA